MTWWRKLLRWLTVIGLVLALIAGIAVVILRVFLEGEALADRVAELINTKVRGRVEIASIDWDTDELPTLVSGGWVPVTMRGVRVWDGKGADATLLLDTRELTGEIDAHALLFRQNIVLRHVRVDGGELLLQQVDEPYPLHAYDRSVVSLLAAFYPVRKPSFGAGISVSSSSIFDIRDFELRGMHVRMLMGNYTTTADADPHRVGPPVPRTAYTFSAELWKVSARGFVYMDASDSLVPKLYFALADPVGTPWDAARARAPGAKPRPGLESDFAIVKLFDADHDPSYEIPLDRLEFTRIAQVPRKWPADDLANTLELVGSAHTPFGATMDLRGEIQDYWDRPFDGTWAIAADARNLGRTLHEVVSPKLAEKAADVRGHFELRGPYIALPKITFALTGLDVDVPMTGDQPLPLSLARLEGVIDNVNEQITIDKTVARGAGGEVEIDGTIQMSPLQMQGSLVVTRPLDLGPYLPATVRDTIGDRLSGRTYVTGDISEVLQFTNLQLALGRARFSHGAITAKDYFDSVAFADVRVDADATTASLNGQIDILNSTFDLHIGADSPDLATWLRRLGAPALARSGAGDIAIAGAWDAPAISGGVRARGVPVVDDVSAHIALDGDRLAISSLSSRSLGALSGGGTLRLGATPRLDDFRLSGRKLDAGKVGGGLMTGSINSVELRASGPLDPGQIRLTGAIDADGVTIAGEPWGHVAMCINDDGRSHADVCTRARPAAPPADDPYGPQRRAVAQACAAVEARGGVCLTGHADRTAGGAIDVTAVVGGGDVLHGAIDVTDLPFGAFLRAPAPAGGRATSHLFLGGTTARPTAEGALHLARAWVLAAFLGDADVAVAPAGPGEVAFTGALLGGRVNIKATVGTSAPFPTTFTIDVRRLDLDPFVDLGAQLGLARSVRAWASGQVTVQTELAPRAGPPPLDAIVALSEFAITLDDADADGRPTPITITAASPVRLRYHDGKAAFVCVDQQPGAPPHVTDCPAVFNTPAGELALRGSASPDALDLHAQGKIDMALLRPLFQEYIEKSGGVADLGVDLTGTPAKPVLGVDVALHDVWFEPPHLDTVIALHSGQIKLKDNDDLGFADTKLVVTDKFSGATSELELLGSVKLQDFAPVGWALELDGKLPAKLLVALAPESFSQASGVADLSLSLSGPGRSPPIDGTLAFDEATPFTLVPRGVHREISFTTGAIDLFDQPADTSTPPCEPRPIGAAVASRGRYRIDLCHVGGSIDDEGRLRNILGSLEIVDGALAGGDVTLRADGLPFRIPQLLDLVVNANAPDQPLHLAYDDVARAWSLTGALEVVSGSYTRSFDLGELVIRPTSTSSAGSSKPFWEEYPAIGATNLDLSLDLRRFAVDNNLALIDMSGQLAISGTPRDPRLEGVIQVERGTFRLPGSRASFTRTTGSVAFSRLYRFPAQTPTLAITSEADYRDPSGQNHLITLSIEGALSQLNWNLYTSSGLNKAQTMTLIFSGRTPEQFRRQLGNDAVAGDPSHIDPTTNPNDSYADQLIKDVAADFISLLVEDSLKDVSKLDVARLEIGTGSVGFHAEKKFLDNLVFYGDVEQTVRGSTLYLRGEYRTPVKVILQGGWLQKSFDDAAEEDIRDPEVKLVYRLFIP